MGIGVQVEGRRHILAALHQWEVDSMLGKRCRAVAVMSSVLLSAAICVAPQGVAVPGPEVEYTYNVIVRRHFDFPNNDAIGYGYVICDKVTRGLRYTDVMSDVKRDVFPSDEQSANYVVSNAVGILCPAQISRLRSSAAGYRPGR